MKAGFETKLSFDIDVVLVIDCTESMQPFLDPVKRAALKYHEIVTQALTEKSREVHRMRVRVVAYRDFYDNRQDGHPNRSPLIESRFYHLPDESEEYAAFVNGLEAVGGSGGASSGLEALHAAIRSEWSNDPQIFRKRQIIVVFSNTAAHPLDHPGRYDVGRNGGVYPEGVPEDLRGLETEYLDDSIVRFSDHRLVLLTPDAEPWNQIRLWNQVAMGTMKPEEGPEELLYRFTYGGHESSV